MVTGLSGYAVTVHVELYAVVIAHDHQCVVSASGVPSLHKHLASHADLSVCLGVGNASLLALRDAAARVEHTADHMGAVLVGHHRPCAVAAVVIEPLLHRRTAERSLGAFVDIGDDGIVARGEAVAHAVEEALVALYPSGVVGVGLITTVDAADIVAAIELGIGEAHILALGLTSHAGMVVLQHGSKLVLGQRGVAEVPRVPLIGEHIAYAGRGATRVVAALTVDRAEKFRYAVIDVVRQARAIGSHHLREERHPGHNQRCHEPVSYHCVCVVLIYSLSFACVRCQTLCVCKVTNIA